MTDLASKTCEPCRGGVPPLEPEAIAQLRQQLQQGWQVVENKKLERAYDFNDFREALSFTNVVAEIAEQQDHHPDIHLSYGKVKLVIWTHKIDGLSESDFILAAKVDQAQA